MDSSFFSRQQLNRNSLSDEVARTGAEMAPCTACRKAKPDEKGNKPRCIVGARSRRCSECARKGYAKCDVTVSRPEWMKLRDLREKYRNDLISAEEEEAVLLEKLAQRKIKTARLRKQLADAESRTASAVAQEVEDAHVADELDELLGVEAIPQGAAFHDIIEMPPSDWGLLDGVVFPEEEVVPESPRL